MKRIAAPMVGGMLTSTLLTLVVIPAIYSLWKEHQLPRDGRPENAREQSTAVSAEETPNVYA